MLKFFGISIDTKLIKDFHLKTLGSEYFLENGEFIEKGIINNFSITIPYDYYSSLLENNETLKSKLLSSYEALNSNIDILTINEKNFICDSYIDENKFKFTFFDKSMISRSADSEDGWIDMSGVKYIKISFNDDDIF